MTALDLRDANPRPRVTASTGWMTSPRFAVLVWTLLSCALTASRAADVWTTGAFFDTDDATRALQVRAWLGGQGWFDLVVPGMDPAVPVPMHWSRVVDVPVAALELIARPFVGADLAERIARLVFPTALLAALLWACGRAAGVLGGARARIPAIALCFAGAPFFGQFVPGRIDHHAPQILLLVLIAGATMAAFEPARWRNAAAAGGLAALSLSISLENLPFIAVVAAAFGLLFVVRGKDATLAVLAFSGGLALALIILFVTTVAPASRWPAACDAYSLAHLAPGLAGCAALAVLALTSPRLRSLSARIAATAALAPLPLAALLAIAPTCAGDPFVGLDPLVRDVWLHNVAEVEPVFAFARSHPFAAATIVAPMLLATLVAFAQALAQRGLAGARHALFAALLFASLAGSLWGIRTLSSGLPLIAVVAAPFLASLAGRLGATPLSRAAALALLGLPFAPLAYAYALPADAPATEGGDTLSCLTPAALAPLAALPPGLVLAPIDAGAHLLAFTPHAVLGSPYHRDNHGNRLVLDALFAAPDIARGIVVSSGAAYLAVCPAQVGARILARRAPEGLAARLLANEVPDWLEPVALPSPMRVFRVR